MPALLRTEAFREPAMDSASPARLAVVRDRPAPAPSGGTPVVVVVDDHDGVRESLCELLESVGIAAAGFGSAHAFLASELADRPGCLILDVRMPGMGGLALQDHLIARGDHKPIIFLSGHADVPMTVQAMKAGAIDFLTKPVREQTLLDAVAAGLAADAERRASAQVARRSADLYAALTDRERQVMAAVVRGQLNKCIAFDLGISEVTVKLHRSSMMRKMATRSVADLVRAWQSLPHDARETRHAAFA